ncbi:MAG: M55 family metallopeptidase [Thermaerobacterales bacterium]
MKIYISVDMEGVAGIVDRAQGSAGGMDYGRGRQLMTLEAASAAQAALDAGADEVVISDSHGSNGSRNLIIEDLPEDVWLISGDSRPLLQMQELDESYDALIMIGYHTRHGFSGVLDHTISGRDVYEVRINGRPVGEVEINAALAGHFGVPVTAVSGDNKLADELAEWLPWSRRIVVKRAVGRHAAASMHPRRARALIYDEVKASLENLNAMQPLVVDTPVTIDYQCKVSSAADLAAGLTGIERVDDLTVRIVRDDYLTAFKDLRVAIQHAGLALAAAMASGGGKVAGT